MNYRGMHDLYQDSSVYASIGTGTVSMLSVYLSSDQTVCCYCLETLGPNFWRELTSWTPDTQAVCASQSEASIMSQWPIRGQDIQTGRHNHKILEIGERRRTIVSRVMWALLNIKKRETEKKQVEF